MFRDNEAFLNKWKAILNKCSRDLTLLIMEQSIAIASENDTEIDTLKARLESENDKDTFESKFKKLQEEVSLLEKNIRELKMRKFRRDQRDYNNQNVYTFNLTPLVKTKRVTWGDMTYTDIDSTEGEDSAGTSADEGTSMRERYDRAAKGKAKEKGFRSRPYRRGRRRT